MATVTVAQGKCSCRNRKQPRERQLLVSYVMISLCVVRYIRRQSSNSIETDGVNGVVIFEAGLFKPSIHASQSTAKLLLREVDLVT